MNNDNDVVLDPAEVVKELRQLRHDSDPSGGDETAQGITVRAARAVELAWMLLEQEAGWALDHIGGLGVAVQGPLQRLPLSLCGVERDVHEHGQREWDMDNPRLRRRAVAAVIQALPDTVLGDLLKEFGEALEALEVGHVEDVLKPEARKRGDRSFPPSTWYHHLRAWEHFKFRLGAGMSTEEAKTAVINAYVEMADSSFENWETTAREMFGGRAVLCMEVAYQGGRGYLEKGGLSEARLDESYGDDALTEDGHRYKNHCYKNEKK